MAILAILMVLALATLLVVSLIDRKRIYNAWHNITGIKALKM